MSELLRWILGLAATVAAVLFAIANRAFVPVIWNPLGDAVNLPVYALALGGAVIGFFIGGGLVWLNATELRRSHRRQKKHIRRLENEAGENFDDRV